ncbi:hypothetical protein C8Q80DRAFT_1111133 [Daedaleopsis nitida]|nr:hypothetical protein C8Q80DRAFT_1111133 [Daedaleopsis nitida]
MTPIFQHAFYIGNCFNNILYGIELVLYFFTIWPISKRAHKRHPSDITLALFTTAILCLNTVYVATESVFGEQMWITNEDYPGGPGAYLADYASVWYETLGTAASIVLNLFGDAFLIYRCFVIWGDFRPILFPSFLCFTSLCIGIAQLIASGHPHANYFAGLAKKLGIAYTTAMISNQALVTTLICARIIYIARRCASAVAPLVRPYTGAVAVVVESALPSTLFGLAYLVTFALDSELSVFFLSVYVMSTCIAPQMIVLRVVSGRAWSRRTTEDIMTSAQTMDSRDHLSSIVVLEIESQLDADAGYPPSALVSEKV